MSLGALATPHRPPLHTQSVEHMQNTQQGKRRQRQSGGDEEEDDDDEDDEDGDSEEPHSSDEYFRWLHACRLFAQVRVGRNGDNKSKNMFNHNSFSITHAIFCSHVCKKHSRTTLASTLFFRVSCF